MKKKSKSMTEWFCNFFRVWNNGHHIFIWKQELQKKQKRKKKKPKQKKPQNPENPKNTQHYQTQYFQICEYNLKWILHNCNEESKNK